MVEVIGSSPIEPTRDLAIGNGQLTISDVLVSALVLHRRVKTELKRGYTTHTMG
jgi:hypothetical protein